MSELLEILGFALIVAGVALWSVPAAFIVAGVGLIVAGVALSGPTRTVEDDEG